MSGKTDSVHQNVLQKDQGCVVHKNCDVDGACKRNVKIQHVKGDLQF